MRGNVGAPSARRTGPQLVLNTGYYKSNYQPPAAGHPECLWTPLHEIARNVDFLLANSILDNVHSRTDFMRQPIISLFIVSFIQIGISSRCPVANLIAVYLFVRGVTGSVGSFAKNDQF